MTCVDAAGKPTARLFVALWPDDALRQALAAWREPCPGGRGTRPVEPEQLHLTLHFLGNVLRDRLPELGRALRVPLQPFDLGFSRCERWPGGVLVALPDAVPPALADLHAALGDVLHRLGLATEACAFRPHLTLARRHTGALPPAAAVALCWPVHGYALVESGAGAGGGYAVLEAWA